MMEQSASSSEPLTRQRIIKEFHRTLEFEGLDWKRDLFFQRHPNGDITAMFLEIRRSGHVYTLVPRWEAFNFRFVQILYESSDISLRPIRHAITSEAFFEGTERHNSRRAELARLYGCISNNPGYWSIQTQRDLSCKVEEIAKAFIETREQYRAETRTLEGVARRVIRWPKDGPIPSMPARYGMRNWNIVRIIAWHILGDRKAMLEEFEWIKSRIKRINDPVYGHHQRIFVDRFAQFI